MLWGTVGAGLPEAGADPLFELGGAALQGGDRVHVYLGMYIQRIPEDHEVGATVYGPQDVWGCVLQVQGTRARRWVLLLDFNVYFYREAIS